jgi:hypothetical protein
MRPILQTISALALIGTLLPSILYYVRSIDLPTTKTAMFAAAIVWLVITPCWMGRDTKDVATDDAGLEIQS